MEPITSESGETALGASDGAKREEGASLLRQGKFVEAAAALNEATENDPADEGAWRLLGGAFASQGDYSRAAAAFQRAIALAPANARNNYNLGLALEALERTAEARSAFEQALRIDPTYVAAQTRLDALGGAFGVSTNSPDPLGMPATEPVYPAPVLRDTENSTVPEPRSLYGSEPAQSGLSNIGFAPENSISALPPSSSTYVPQPVLGAGSDFAANDSGMKAGAPPEIAVGWNWGAFYFSWIWMLNHQLVGWGIGLLVVNFIPYLGALIHLGAAIYLGVKGNELGWSNRRFQSAQDFKLCQSIWAKWALGMFLVGVVLGVLLAILYIFIIAAALSTKDK